MAETHVELNQFPVPRVGPRHSTHVFAPFCHLVGNSFRDLSKICDLWLRVRFDLGFEDLGLDLVSGIWDFIMTDLRF